MTDPVVLTKINVAINTHSAFRLKPQFVFKYFLPLYKKILCHSYIWDWVQIWEIRNKT